MDRFKFIGLVLLPLLISLAPSPWFMLEKGNFEAAKLGTIDNDRINECSGIAISRVTKDALWLHNDSGDAPRLYLVGFNGKTRSTAEIKGATAIDWEDMCSFSLDGSNWLLIGDTGDNPKNRGTRRARSKLYLVEEPSKIKKKLTLKAERVIQFEYEDGPHDCEGIAVDTASKTILLITKSLLPGGCHVYTLPLKPKQKTAIAKKVADVPVPVVTGLDLSPDGQRLAIVTPRNGFIVNRTAGESWSQAMAKRPGVFQPPRAPQIEAICFGSDGQKLHIISEGMNQPIWQLVRGKPKR